MKRLGFKDFLVISAFGFNIATYISYLLGILFWFTLSASTGFLLLAVILTMEEEE